MRHLWLTCLHHSNLRWFCKSIAVNRDGSYNGARHIFHQGRWSGTDEEWLDFITSPEGKADWTKLVHDVGECECSAKDLRLAPGETYEEN
jgi:hypothetical protein